MFVHLLVWDEHSPNEFLGELLAAVFDITTYCEYVILVVPPRVTPGDLSTPIHVHLPILLRGLGSLRCEPVRHKGPV